MPLTSPIVLVHGIQGAQLAQAYDDSYDVIWSGIQKGFESIWDLELDADGEVEADPFDWIVPLKLEWLAYGELVGKLRKEFPRTPVYLFRYDWRLDLASSARRFGAFLDEVAKRTRRRTVRVVTHSMGGLVLAAWLGLDPSRHSARIDRAVMATPPFRGAVDAVRVLVVGEAPGLGIRASQAYRKIARTFPSAYQLVPSYPGHWSHPDPQADIWDVGFWQHRVRFGTRPRQPYQDTEALMGRRLQRAKAFHAGELVDFDALASDRRSRFLVLFGTGEKTRESIRVKRQNRSGEIQWFFDFEHRSTLGDGDGTVPVVSTERWRRVPRLGVDVSRFSAWWPSLWDDKAKIGAAGFHAMFLALDKVQGLVVDWLAGRRPKATWAERIQP